jgi:uncharacterized protein (TIGR02271 family)
LFGESDSEESGRYAEALRRGSAVVVLDASDEASANRAKTILEQLGGAVDMDERAAQWQTEGWTAYGTGAAVDRRLAESDEVRSRSGTEAKTVVPVVEEQVKVGKREVQGGGVRVIQRVTQTPIRELVRLREERAVVERRPADRPATESDFKDLDGRTVEVRERVEEPVVSKTAKVVEEVVVGKDVRERTETVSDTVRKAQVQVEPLKGSAAQQDETEARTRIRGAGEDALEQADDAIGRASRKVSKKTNKQRED